MKNTFLLLLILSGFSFSSLHAQDIPKDSTATVSAKIYIIKTQNGGVFMGTIVFQDSKEVVIKTNDKGEISIPKYEIKEMKELASDQLDSSGNLVFRKMFSTRYFLTTNGLAMEKGDSYTQTNLFGPEVHFAVGKSFNIGIITSWLMSPILIAAKQSFKLSDNVHLGVGALLGHGGWLIRRRRIGLPFGALTLGNSKSNFNISYGLGMVRYGGLGDPWERTNMLSIAFMAQLSDKVSLVFDSMIFPETESGFFTPGIRFQTEENRAFQFGVLMLGSNSNLNSFPIPMLTWFRKF